MTCLIAAATASGAHDFLAARDTVMAFRGPVRSPTNFFEALPLFMR